MRAFFSTIAARVRGFVRPAAGDVDFDGEMDAHLAMAEEDMVRRGLSREQARRQARLELGGVAQLREAARSARGLPWLDGVWLDGKLGVRMLRKSWGLTLVGGLAMAITIGLGASIVTIWTAFAGTDLPLDEGERVVAVQPFDRVSQQVLRDTPLADFRRWREAVASLEQLSAMRAIRPTVIMRNGPAGAVNGAEMTASAFRLARVPPLLGRPLLDEDEREGAEPVAVIGHRLWESGFSSDTGVLGQRVQIGDTSHIVVGVMPDGFRFPMNQDLWTALRSSRVDETGRQGAGAFVFARLAPGATLERAQAEVAALGLNARADAAVQFQIRVVPYAAGVFPAVHDNGWAGGVTFLIGVLLLVPPCANIAILVYARTVTRREEFSARSALGASRARIVMQLFVEVLVLAAGAGILGLVLARQFSERLSRIALPGMGPDSIPFWIDITPSLATVLAVAGLSVLAAAMAGAIPAYHATGGRKIRVVQALGDRGAGLGRTWTALLAMQVALSLAVLPSGLEMAWGIFRPGIVGPSLPVDEFLTGQLGIQGSTSRIAALQAEAARRLASEPGVSGVTMSSALLMEEIGADIEVEGFEVEDNQVRFNSVDDRYFEVFDARFLAGRTFDARDSAAAARVAIVNRSFVREIVGDSDVLGRRVRYVERQESGQAVGPGPWHEIVGVVEDFPGENDGPIVYHPINEPLELVSVTIRTSSDMDVAAARLRAIAALDPGLRVGRIRSLEEIHRNRRSLEQTFGLLLGALMLIALLFSMAGVYTLMTFIVARRWREIGLRSALGARPRRLLVGIFGRAAAPLAIGGVVGCALALFIQSSLPIEEAGGQRIPGVVLASAALMTVVGLVAVAGPARRAIRIDPTEALRVS